MPSSRGQNLTILLVLISFISGCASHSRALSEPSFDRPVILSNTPFFPQDAYQCGPAALATLLGSAGVNVTPKELEDSLYISKRKGTLQVELLATARKFDVIPVSQEGTLNTLWQALEHRTPVLILQNLAFSWYPKWHYAVVVGFDPKSQEVLLRSGREKLRREKLHSFEESWRLANHWMLSLLPGEPIPPFIQEQAYITAVNGLYETGHQARALSATESAAQHWPNSMLSWMALGNLHYQQQHYQRAERAYRSALNSAPSHPAPPHNLAWALIKQSKKAEAKKYALLALERSATLPAHLQAAYQSAHKALM